MLPDSGDRHREQVNAVDPTRPQWVLDPNASK